jgi:hypothetical protein
MARDSMTNSMAHISINSGTSFNTSTSMAGSNRQPTIARGNGNYMAHSSSTKFRTSSDAGASWTDRTNTILANKYAYSDDGGELFLVETSTNDLYVSNDNGATISLLDNIQEWKNIISDSDGKKLVGITSSNEIFLIANP